MSITFQALIQGTIKRLYAEKQYIVRASTAQGAAAGATLIDARLIDNRSDADTLKFVDAWIRIPVQVTPTWAAEDIRQIGAYAPATGTLTPIDAFSAQTPASLAYEVHYELPPASLKDCVIRSLRNLRRRAYSPLTVLTDGDMETSGVTNWAATNCTPTKLTAAASVMHGSQSLRVLNSAGNGYVQSATIPVIEGQSWLIPAYVRCAVGRATLIPWDVTNGAAIATTGDGWSTDETAWTELGGGETITIPAGCEGLALRLRGTGASDDIYWDSVLPFDTERGIIDLPSYITQENQVRGLFTFPRGEDASGGGYEIRQSWQQQEYDWLPLVDEAAATPWQIQVPHPLDRPLFLYADRPWAELTLDADTTNADEDTVVAGAVALAYELLGRNEYGHWAEKWGGKKAQVQPEPNVIQTSRWVSLRAR